MSSPIHIQYFDSPYGELVLGAHDGKLCLCDWRYRKKRAAIDARIQTALQVPFLEQDDALLQQTRSQLKEYFQGQRKQFDIELLMLGSDFQQRVWKALLTIPFGQSTSYLQLAQTIGQANAVRAVASANGANAISILIPCHRVIGGDGRLISYAGGLRAKEQLLRLESETPQQTQQALLLD